LENWLIAEKNLGFVVEVGIDCLALSLVVLFGSLWLGMLFVKVLEGKIFLFEVYELSLYAVCSCMVGNIVKGIFGSWIGNLGEGC
jgi:hypothetical protein